MGLEMNWAGNMVLLEKLALDDIARVMESLLCSLQWKVWAGQVRVKNRSGISILDR